jgi:hypothetical protein
VRAPCLEIAVTTFWMASFCIFNDNVLAVVFERCDLVDTLGTLH